MTDGPARIIANEAGTNVAEVKAASTAAAAGDAALVVAVSPNNTPVLPSGAATAALQTQPGVDIGDVTINNGAGAGAVNVQDGGNSLTTDTPQLPAALVGGRLDSNVGAWLGSTSPTVGQKTMANSLPMALASDQSALPVTLTGPGVVGVEGVVADGAAIGATKPVVIGGSDGANAQTLLLDQSGRVLTREYDEPTFVIAATNVGIGSGKSLLSIVNAGSAVLRVREVWLMNARTASVTGVAGEFHLRRITGHSGGSDLSTTPGFLAHDTADAVPSGLTARSGATVTGEAADPLHRRRWSTDEWGPGTLDAEGYALGVQNSLPFYRSERPMKPITIRTGQGLSVRFQTASTAGAFDVVAVVSEGVL